MESFFVKICEIKLRNFALFDKLDLKFNPPESTIFLKSNNKLKFIIESIKFIVHPFYLNRNNAKLLLKENCDEGSVEIIFVDTVSETKYFAERNFSSIDYVKWETISRGVEEIPIYKFQQMYFPAADCYSLEISDTANILKSYFNKIWSAYDTYLHCASSLDKDVLVDSDDIVLNMYITSRTYMNALEIRDNFHIFFTICKLVNEIFQKISNSLIGTVHFFIRSNDNFNTFESFDTIRPEDFDWNTEIITAIKFYEKKTSEPVIWTNLNEYLKTILKLSTKIALAHYHSEKNLFLISTDFMHLEFEQNVELIYSKVHTNSESWIKNNYLQNIIKISKEYNLNMIICYNNILKQVSNAYQIVTNEYTEEVEVRLLNNENNELMLPNDLP